MNVFGNAVVSQNNLIFHLMGYPQQLWYDLKVISNILSLALVDRYFPGTYGKEKICIVDKGSGNSASVSG